MGVGVCVCVCGGVSVSVGVSVGGCKRVSSFTKKTPTCARAHTHTHKHTHTHAHGTPTHSLRDDVATGAASLQLAQDDIQLVREDNQRLALTVKELTAAVATHQRQKRAARGANGRPDSTYVDKSYSILLCNLANMC